MNITAGKYKNQKITTPDESITRPTLSKVRMAVFNTLQALIDFENASFFMAKFDKCKLRTEFERWRDGGEVVNRYRTFR